MRQLNDCPFCITKQQHVGLCIQQDRSAYFFAPVIKMCNTPKACLDASYDDRHVWIGFPATLGINNDRPVGPAPTNVTWRIGIVMANFLIRCVTINHGIHVARGNPKIEIRLSQDRKFFRPPPLGLRDDTNPETLRFQHPANNGHAEAGVIHIGIPGYNDHITAIPAQGIHLGP